MAETRGFIVSAWDEFRSRGETLGALGDRMLITGRLEDGRSFAALRASPGPAIFVARDRADEARSAILSAISGSAIPSPEDWRDMEDLPLARLCLPPGTLRAAERALAAAGIAVAGLDRRRADEELAALGIRGPVLIRGEERPGKRVDAVFVDPGLESPPKDGAGFRTKLRWLALDIETDREEGVVAVSLAENGLPGEVLFVQGRGGAPTAAGIEVFPDESSLLGALAARIARRDPDVLTGWNIIDFDFKVIIARCAALGLSFDAGRTDTPSSFAERSDPRDGRKGALNIPGRAVIDAMRLVRAGGGASGPRYEDLSLETVARGLLGEGKSVASRGEDKIEELELLRSRDPDAFCAYCLRDSQLVLRILAKTGLDELTSRRAALTGVSLDLAWTSIPAFERVYGAELRARHIAIPAKTDRRVSGAAGGTVLEASAGIFPRVLVYDFRSLYPSIMRTFNVDPLAYARAAARPESAVMSSRGDDITAPNGARFDRRAGVMPGLIAEYSAERERAIAEGDEVAAYVYKILQKSLTLNSTEREEVEKMQQYVEQQEITAYCLKILQNSFYGVLGAEGCRYARTELAGAITSFGKKFLTMARDFFEARGQRVLYGDTDSVFVLSGTPKGTTFTELITMGNASADTLNLQITKNIEEEYRLKSHLRIRCEKAYKYFLIPRLKSNQSGEGRGRAKGYAGLLLQDRDSIVEVKGMEAVRSDFTPLARDFQLALLRLVFSEANEEELRNFCLAEVEALKQGKRDDKLVYKKMLRANAEDYTSETPQVKAARMMGWTTKRGRVSYIMTNKGAQPVGAGLAPPDYNHYISNQLLPIAASIADVLGYDAHQWLADGSQFELDFQ
jgi:DNA polymerase-2